MLALVMPQALTVAVDVVAWGVFHSATGYAAFGVVDRGNVTVSGAGLLP